MYAATLKKPATEPNPHRNMKDVRLLIFLNMTIDMLIFLNNSQKTSTWSITDFEVSCCFQSQTKMFCRLFICWYFFCQTFHQPRWCQIRSEWNFTVLRNNCKLRPPTNVDKLCLYVIHVSIQASRSSVTLNSTGFCNSIKGVCNSDHR